MQYFSWPVGLLMAAILGLAAYLVVAALRRAAAAVAAERDLRQQVSELTHAGETLSRMAAIVESSDDAIIGRTPEGIITSWNPAAERIYGYSARETIGKSVSMLVPPERSHELKQIVEKILRGERVDHVETVRVRKDGQRIHVSLTVSPIKDGTGQILGASSIVRDITERKRAGETLSRMAAIVESSDDAIIGKTLDENITSWNPAAERMYGYAAPEVIGKSVSVLVPPDHPDELQHILEKIRHGERVDHVETVRMRKDGRRIHVSLTVSPIKDTTGEITGASTIARDITERMRTQEALRESEERYRDLVEHSEDLICTHDLEGRFLSVNPAMLRLLGYWHEADLLGRKLSDFLPSDVLPMFDTYLDTVQKERYAQGLMTVLTRDGQERILEYRNSLRTQGLAQPIVRSMAHDVTGRVQAERELGKRIDRIHTLRTATLELVRELDLPALLGLVVRRAAALLGALSGAVYLWDEASQTLVAQAYYSLGEWTRGKRLRLGEEIPGAVAERREGMIVNDYQGSAYASSLFLERASFTAVIAEPLLYHDRLIGVLTVNNEGTWQRFTEEDDDLLGLFAVEAAIAIENARLHSALTDSKRRLEELYELGLAMQEERSLKAGLDLILKGAQTVLGFDRMNILLANPEGTRLTAVASLGTEEPLGAIAVPVGPEGGGIARAFLKRQDIVWEGAGPVPEEWRLAFPYSEIKAFRSRCYVIVPLVVRGAAIGVLGADNKLTRKPITTETIHLLKTFAAQAALTIDDARLYEEVTTRASQMGQRPGEASLR